MTTTIDTTIDRAIDPRPTPVDAVGDTTASRQGRTVVIVDVDGVLSPVHPTGPTWGDEKSAGDLFGPVMMSPTLARRLEALHDLPGVECCWLTSWTAEMREDMPGFPGRRPAAEWEPVIDGVPSHVSDDEEGGWWKLDALLEWLRANPDVTAVAWLDDHLVAHGDDDGFRHGRIQLVRSELTEAGVTNVHLIAPQTPVGLTPTDMDQLEWWVNDRLNGVLDSPQIVVPATGNGMKSHDFYDTFLTLSGGDGNHTDHAEVHVKIESNDGEQFAQGWFRADQLHTALSSAHAPDEVPSSPALVDELRKLHKRDKDFCDHDGRVWPCETIVLLDTPAS